MIEKSLLTIIAICLVLIKFAQSSDLQELQLIDDCGLANLEPAYFGLIFNGTSSNRTETPWYLEVNNANF